MYKLMSLWAARHLAGCSMLKATGNPIETGMPGVFSRRRNQKGRRAREFPATTCQF